MLKDEGIVIVLSGVGNGERLRNRLMTETWRSRGYLVDIGVFGVYGYEFERYLGSQLHVSFMLLHSILHTDQLLLVRSTLFRLLFLDSLP